MSNVVYFRSTKYFVRQYLCFNPSNNSAICVWNNECNVKTYEDSEEFHRAIKTTLENESIICDKSEFDEALNKYEATLKEIKSQL